MFRQFIPFSVKWNVNNYKKVTMGLIAGSMVVGSAIDIHNIIQYKEDRVIFDRKAPYCLLFPMGTFYFAIVWPVWVLAVPISGFLYVGNNIYHKFKDC